MQNKKLILPIYLIVEVIYYITITYTIEGVGMIFWIVCSLLNTYFVVYAILPDYLKRNIKSKNIILKSSFYFVVILIGFLITNGPIEILIKGSV